MSDAGPNKQVVLGDILTALQYGSSSKATVDQVGVPVLRMGNIQNGRICTKNLKYLELPQQELNRYLLKSGDILINRTNSAELVGKAGIFELPGDFVFASYLIRLCVDRKVANPAFINFFINSPDAQGFLKSQSKDSIGQTNINTKQIKQLPVSLPPLKEQERIVSRIESLTTRAQELAEHTQAIASDMQRAVASFYERLAAEAPQKPLEAVASPVRRPITTTPEGSYPELGLRSFGKGTFHKPALSGTEVGGKRIFRIHAGDLVFSNVFGWEGAIAVAQPEDDGRAGSHRYITYLADPAQSTPEFLCFHFLTPRGLEDIRAASPGSAGRNRTLGLERLKQIQVPVPPIEEQRRFTELVKRQREITQHAASITEDLRRFEAALLAKAFRGEL